MKKEKRGQLGIETIIVVAIVLVITLPFLGGFLGSLTERMNVETKVLKTVEIVDAIGTVARLGPGNSLAVIVDYPYTIVDNKLILKGATEADDISVTIIPKVEDVSLNPGVIGIISWKDGIMLTNGPEIINLDPPLSVESNVEVRIHGDGFTQNSIVTFHGVVVSSSFLNKNLIKFDASAPIYPCFCTIVVSDYFGGVAVSSNEVILTFAPAIGGGL